MAGHKGTLLIPVPCPGPGAPEARAAQRHIRGLEHLQGWGIISNIAIPIVKRGRYSA